MNKTFFNNTKIDEALYYLYYGMNGGKQNGELAKNILEEEAAKGDADAMYFLARCYSGDSFVWKGHGFKEDDNLCLDLYKRAILNGSQIALLGGIRVAGLMEDLELEKYNTSKYLKPAYETVFKLAEAGEPFCQYMIGNTIKWWDIVKILEIDHQAKDFENIMKSYFIQIPKWFMGALNGGVYFGGTNLINCYCDGFDGFGKKQPEKEIEISEYAAKELENVFFLGYYGDVCIDLGEPEEALMYFEKAYKVGDYEYLNYIAEMYNEGVGTEVDLEKAIFFHKEGIKHKIEGWPNCYAEISSIYYGQNNNIEGEKYCELAMENGEMGMASYYAFMILTDERENKDYKKVKELIEISVEVYGEDEKTDCCYGLMYVDGLGVEEDLEKGMRYLQKVRHLTVAQEKMSEFKKEFTLFGKWIRK